MFTGNPTKLFDLNLSPGVAVLQGSGLGGTSLINANAALMCEPRIFEDPVNIWSFLYLKCQLAVELPHIH